MKRSKQILIALGIVCVIGLMGCRTVEVSSGKMLTREQLDTMLEALLQNKWPETLWERPSKSERPDFIDFVCPLCKTETRLSRERADGLWGIENSYRQYMNRIRELGLDATLDETDTCSQCRKDKNQYLSFFYIEVRLDGRVTRTWLRGGELTMLVAFLEGKYVYAFPPGSDRQMLLFMKINRIGKILGVEDSDTLLDRLEFKQRE